MLGKENFTGTPANFLEKYSARTEMGKLARQHDANSMLEAIHRMESEVKEREKLNASIENRLDRITAEHHLEMDYLFTFGVRCQHREELTRILQEASVHGGLSLQEAAALANARAAHDQAAMPDPGHSVNGWSGSTFSS